MGRVLFALLILSIVLFARNEVPSCYDALKIENKNVTVEKELFILIDQTTIIDKKMMKYTYKNMMKFMKNGYAVNIISFSSNSNGKYTDLVYAGTLEKLMTEESEYDISKKVLRKYQGCMNSQMKYAKKKAKKALIKVFKGASKEMLHSDILKSLSDISRNVIGNSKVKEKVVLLVSDLLEHSSITSFYKQGTIKHINVKKEYAKIYKSQCMANFDETKVYIIGAGILPEKGYRDPKTLKNLTDFWRHYFKSTGADLEEIGTPMLLRDVE